MTKSIYDIKVKSWDGQEDFLAKYKGKVSLLINTTADCGNAPQFAIIEKLYQTYKDKGFEVIAIPTNQYCGPKVTYGEWENGITCAADSKNHGAEKYGVTYDFSEILVSKPGPGAPKDLKEGEVPHELFEEIVAQTDNILMYGNFEKYLINADGQILRKYPNASLLNYGIEQGVPDADSEYERISNDIESALNGTLERKKFLDEYPQLAKV